ncbi:unnamed protein product, partial [Owenia fusiformis]
MTNLSVLAFTSLLFLLTSNLEIVTSMIKTTKGKKEALDIDECSFNESHKVECPKTSRSCKGRCDRSYNNITTTMNSNLLCKCDDKCLHYGDCCEDYVESCAENAKHTASRQDRQDLYECTKIQDETWV